MWPPLPSNGITLLWSNVFRRNTMRKVVPLLSFLISCVSSKTFSYYYPWTQSYVSIKDLGLLHLLDKVLKFFSKIIHTHRRYLVTLSRVFQSIEYGHSKGSSTKRVVCQSKETSIKPTYIKSWIFLTSRVCLRPILHLCIVSFSDLTTHPSIGLWSELTEKTLVGSSFSVHLYLIYPLSPNK